MLSMIDSMPAAVTHHRPLTPAAMVSQVLDCSDHHRFRANCDGTYTAYRILTKPLPGKPTGTVLSLPELHDSLASGGAE